MDILGIINGLASSIASQIGGKISDVLNALGNDIQQYVLSPITSDIGSALSSVGSALGSLESAAVSGIASTVQSVSSTLGNVEAQVVGGFTQGMNAVSSSLQTIESGVVGGFKTFVGELESGFNAIKNGIETEFTAVVKGLETGLEGLSKALLSGIQDIVSPILKFIEQLPADIATIAGKIDETFKGAVSELEYIGKSLASGVENVWKTAENDIKRATDPTTFSKKVNPFGSVIDAIIAEVTGLDITKMDPAAIARLAGGIAAAAAITAAVPFDEGLAFFLGNQAPRILDIAMRGSWRDIEQMANAGTPNLLIPVGELVAAKYKGYIDEDFYLDQMERHGYSDINAGVIFKTGDTLLSLGELISLYYRGEIASMDELYKQAEQIRADKYQVDASINLFKRLLSLGESVDLWRREIMPDGFTDYFDDARASGITEERLQAVIKSSYRLPSIYDSQEFIRRKVDDAAFVEKWGLDYGIDEAYFKLAKAQGYDEDTARKMYRRYWSVPPFFITEGLYRTGKLEKETFREMLIMEGYTPQWADKFIEQLQPTLSLTDIKDLYKYQVIGADEIVDKVVGIGYSIDLAEQYKTLWTASVKLASPIDQTGAQAASQSIKGDTESLIITAYKDHIITRDDALSHLESIKVLPDTAALKLEIADYEMQQKTIKDTYTLVKDEYLSGNLGMTDALQKLMDAGASHDQVVIYQDQLLKAGSAKPKVPTLAEFGSWFKKGFIQIDQFSQALSFLGYGEVWHPYFMLQYGASASQLKKAGYTVGDIPNV